MQNSAHNANLPFVLVKDGYTEKTEKEIKHDELINDFVGFEKIIEKANIQWNLIDTLIIHRHGRLQVNDKIVLVASFSSHRKDSFEACNFIMDYLKKDAPFWKNEFYGKKNEWLTNTS